MACLKHPLRKRKDCPDCIDERKSEYAPIPKPKSVQKELVVPTIKDIIKATKKAKPIKSTISEMVKVEPTPQPVELNKSMKEEIADYIKKEIRKAVAQHLSDVLTEEALSQAKATADVAFQTALVNFQTKIKPIANIQYEHLTIPVSTFNMNLLAKLQIEGWGYRDMLRGETARISGCKGDSVILVRVKNEKWPKVPQY
jgi:hypothetical protein